MRPKLKREEMPIDQVMAIGLVWGHLRARQFEEAFLLAKGCLRVWPDERNLILMHAYAAAEVLEPVDIVRLQATRTADSAPWIDLVLRRAGPESRPPLPIHRGGQRMPDRKAAP